MIFNIVSEYIFYILFIILLYYIIKYIFTHLFFKHSFIVIIPSNMFKYYIFCVYKIKK